MAHLLMTFVNKTNNPTKQKGSPKHVSFAPLSEKTVCRVVGSSNPQCSLLLNCDLKGLL